MKLNLQTDFTKLARATAVAPAGEAGMAPADGRAVLAHDERHLRRRVVELADGGKVLVDLSEPVALNNRDRLLLEDGRQVEIVAAEEALYQVLARNPVHLVELAWHIGNRHLAAQIEENRLVILRDHVIRAMLEGLGATVTDVVEPFSPARGAYSGHDHGHSHGHDHSHGHGHGERDRFGRLPGDPHYGHNHD